ncbi:hypothetical protein ACFYVL_32870 [Streptomyces sp. NPDC004111]|uniref:hypothetical protein n=1 Tax=Streptomyces sp. NPDC004111 TaxID=3364690 RepID=UPI0036AEA7D8
MTAAPPAEPEALDTREPVAEYVTGLQVTRVLRAPDGDGFLWWQRPGSGRPAPLAAPAAHLVPHLPPESGAALLVTPERIGDGLLHRTAGALSVAAWLRDFRPGARQLAAHALASAGRALRELHRVTPPGDASLGVPPGVRRMRAWAYGDGELRRRTLASWGAARCELLLGWADDLVGPDTGESPASPSPPYGLVHGWASAGALIPPLSRGRTALLTGEDLAAGRPELDLGWLLGELAELTWAAPAYDCTELLRVPLAAYGPGPDPVRVGRAAVLRIVTHMQDFATFQGWHDELLDYIAFTAELIDEEGRRAVPRGDQGEQEAP